METISKKSRSVAFLFSTFFGIFGAHRFYVGRGGSGAVMLIMSLLIIGIPVTAIWNLVDWFVIMFGNFKDAEGARVSKW